MSKLTKTQADAIYRALCYAGGDLNRLNRTPSFKARQFLIAAGMARRGQLGEIHVTEAGYDAACAFFGHSMKNAAMTQHWRRITEQQGQDGQTA